MKQEAPAIASIWPNARRPSVVSCQRSSYARAMRGHHLLRPRSRFIPLLSVLVVSLACSLLAACNDKDQGAAPGASLVRGGVPPIEESLFPVVLDRDVRVIAQADGTGIEELPVPIPTPSNPPADGLSPDGRFGAFVRDGAIFMQNDDDPPWEVARAESVSFYWSPDSSHLAYILPSDQLESYAMYVASVDGSGAVPVGESGRPPGEGADGPAWSPDASWIATYSPGYDAVRVLSATGAPAIDIREGSSGHFSWSPDSRLLAFDSHPVRVRPASPDARNVVVVDVTSPGDMRVIADGYWPRWSPAGGRIAFKRDRHAFTIRPDGTGPVDLGLIGNEIYNDFTWSADGRQVEFTRGGPNFPVYTIDLRTAAITRRDAGYDVDWSGGDVQISPDGGQLAFPGYGANFDGWLLVDVISGDVSRLSDEIGSYGGDVLWSEEDVRLAYPAGLNGIFIVEGEAQPARRVSELRASEVAWSPDGERLAIATSSEIAIVAVEGGERTSIDPGDGTPGGLAWSPDGKRLLYEVRNPDEGPAASSQIFVAEIESAQVRPVTDAADIAFGASWSPDGQTIAYDLMDGMATEVWLADADSGSERRFAAGVGGHLAWSPDGSMIAVVAGLHVDVTDVASGTVVRVAEVGGTSAVPGYCPGAIVHWSQDSQTLDVVVTCHPPQI